MVKGVLKMMSTYGIKLEDVLYKFDQLNMLVDWIDFVESSITEGWNIKSTLVKIEVALIDVYGKSYSEEVLKRIHLYLGRKTDGNL